MAISRWDPFREVVALQNRVNSLFREMNEGDSPLTTASFVPAVDIYEDAKKVVRTELDAAMMAEPSTSTSP